MQQDVTFEFALDSRMVCTINNLADPIKLVYCTLSLVLNFFMVLLSNHAPCNADGLGPIALGRVIYVYLTL